MSKKPENLPEVFDGYRSVATDAVKMLRTVPYVDVKMLNKVEDLFNRLADCDIALNEIKMKMIIEEMGQIASAPPINDNDL
jgi:hypothetical protein